MTKETKSELNWLRYCAERCDETKIDASDGLSRWDKIAMKSEALISLYEAAKNFVASCEDDKDFREMYEAHKACEDDRLNEMRS